MTETISNLKNHACPSCDDQLRVNEDDMLSQAAQLLGKEEWTAASDAYDFLLNKEPHDFEALHGKILAAAHMKTPEDMADPEILRSVNYEEVNRCIIQALRDTDSTHKEYFEKVQELFTCGEEYAVRQDDVECSTQKRKEQHSKHDAKKREKSMPIRVMLGVGIPLAVLDLVFLAARNFTKGIEKFFDYIDPYAAKLEYMRKAENFLILFFVGLAILIILVIVCLIKFFRARKTIDKELKSIEEDLESLEVKLKSDVDEADKMQKRIRELSYEIKKIR